MKLNRKWLLAIALLLPVTYSMEPVAALVMLMAIYTAAMTGGSISAILLHTPGTPANAATAMEGYPLTKQGRGLEAIGMSMLSSGIGGLLSAIAQGRVAAGSINILARKPDDWSKGLILCGIVEFYAILSLLASMLMLLWI